MTLHCPVCRRPVTVIDHVVPPHDDTANQFCPMSGETITTIERTTHVDTTS